MTLREIERRLSRAGLFFGHGAKSAREEAAWLLSRKRDVDITAVLRRRIEERIPLAYLLREAWLGNYRFYVDERAIVPRSFIAEQLRERLAPWLTQEPKRALDLCTGSGCLAVLLALTFRTARVDASDISASALEVARINVAKYGLGRRVRLVRADLLSGLKTYDLIVCNPPYVPTGALRRLPREYRHEPSIALGAGAGGLDLVRKILSGAKRHLKPKGVLVCEIGGRRRALERAYPQIPFIWPETSDPGTVFILPREYLPNAAAPSRRSRAARDRGRRARSLGRSRRAPGRAAV